MTRFIEGNLGSEIAAAPRITVTSSVHYVSGDGDIASIDFAPSPPEEGVALYLIPRGGGQWRLVRGGNIVASAGAGTMGEVVALEWDGAQWTDQRAAETLAAAAMELRRRAVDVPGTDPLIGGDTVTAVPAQVVEAIRLANRFGGSPGGGQITTAAADFGGGQGLVYAPSTLSAANGIPNVAAGVTVVDARGGGMGGVRISRQHTSNGYITLYVQSQNAVGAGVGMNAISILGDATAAGSGTNVIGVQGQVASNNSAGVFGVNQGSNGMGGPGVQGDGFGGLQGCIGVLGTSGGDGTKAFPNTGIRGMGEGNFGVGVTANSYALTVTAVPTIGNGVNNDVAIGTAGIIRLTIGGGLFTITGFANGFPGRILEVINVGGAPMQFTNADSRSAAANQILTPTGAPITIARSVAWASFWYDAPSNAWLLRSYTG